MKCKHCDEGAKLLKLKRQYVHYIDRKIIVCVDREYYKEPDDRTS